MCSSAVEAHLPRVLMCFLVFSAHRGCKEYFFEFLQTWTSVQVFHLKYTKAKYKVLLEYFFTPAFLLGQARYFLDS